MAQLPNIRMQGRSSLPALLVFLALLAGFLFYFLVIKPGQINEYQLSPATQMEMTKFRRFKDLRFDFSVFDRIDFKNLRIFGEVPVKTAPGGKTDLFQ